MQGILITIVIIASSKIWRIKDKKGVLILDEIRGANGAAVDRENSIKTREANAIADAIRKPAITSGKPKRRNRDAVIQFAGVRHELVGFLAIQIKPARNGLKINKTILGKQRTNGVKDKLTFIS